MFRLLMIGLAIVMSGCASTSFKSNMETLSPEQTMVIGRVQVFEDGKPTKIGTTWWEAGYLRLLLRRANDSEIISYNIPDPGFFSWSLSPGEYSILGFVTLRLYFSIPPNEKEAYIGDIILSFKDSYYVYDVNDSYAEAIENFNSKMQESKIMPKREIAQKEKPPGTFTRVMNICNAAWGVDCKHGIIGVKPIYPSGVRGNVVDSTMPTLKWTASSQPEVAYDIAIYDVVKYPRNQTGLVKDSITGKLVHYSQGVAQPSLKLLQPLRPNTQYYWSVRLRKGETVSTWSTCVIVDFYVLALEVGRGQLFSFTTPDK
jgi:hypothetical protein